MKKTITIIALALLSLTSCKKEEITKTPEPTPSAPCNCGTIEQSGTNYNSTGIGSWVKVVNECSGNLKIFNVPFSPNLQPGTKWCDEVYFLGW